MAPAKSSNLAFAKVVDILGGGNDDLPSDLKIFFLEPSIPFTFIPGQYCTIGLEGIERPYSIVSAPRERYLELFIELIPKEFHNGSVLTPLLWQLHQGDLVTLRPKAKGAFMLSLKYDVIAGAFTVTGIAPMMSMIRARRAGYYQRDWERRWYIFHGASYQNEFGYNQELMRYQKEGLLIYRPTVSRPHEDRNRGWIGLTGRVNNILLDEFKHWGIIPDGKTAVYLCGNDGMVKDLGNKKNTETHPSLGELLTEGFAAKDIKEEVFF